MRRMRGRYAPLAVRPFGRLLSSYTLNELGDSVGLVALAVLVYDRTQAVAPTAAFFFAAKFLPALLAPPLTARFDQVALRQSLPLLYLAEALAFAALALLAETTFVLGLVLALGLLDGALAITARGLTRGAVATVLQPKGLLKEGNALMNMGFAFSAVGGAALAGLLIGEFGIADRAARRRRVVPRHRRDDRRHQGPARRLRRARAVAGALRRRHALRPQQPARAAAARSARPPRSCCSRSSSRSR